MSRLPTKKLLRGFRAGFWSAIKSSQTRREPLRQAARAVIEAMEKRIFLSLAAPTNLAVVSSGIYGGELDLTWSAVTNATGYDILRKDPGSSSFVPIDTATTNSYQDTNQYNGLSTNTFYQYEVIATDGNSADNSSPSSTSATTSNLTVTPLNWDGGGVYVGDGFKLEALTNELDIASASISWGGTDTTPATGLSENVDWGSRTGYLTASHTYTDPGTYYATLTMTLNDGAVTTADMPVTVAEPPPVITVSSIHAVAGQNLHNFFVATAYTPDTSLHASDFTGNISWGDGNSTAASFTAEGNGVFNITGNYTYSADGTKTVSVSATAGGLTGTGSSDAAITLDTPSAPVVSGTPGGSQIQISWAPVTAATAYQVFRGTDLNSPLTLLDTAITSTTYSDTDHGAGLEPGKTYYYQIRAIHSSDTSQLSDILPVTTAALAITPPWTSGVTLYQGDTLNLSIKSNDTHDPTESLSWGDGNSTSPQSEPDITRQWSDGQGTEYFSSSHAYSDPGQYPATLTVTPETGSSVTYSFTVDVESAVSLTTPGILATAGDLFSGAVATFSDGAQGFSPTNTSVAISWGDNGNATTTGTVVAGDSAGQWDVLGNHTYSAQGTDSLFVTVDGITSAAATGSGIATVIPAPTVATGATAVWTPPGSSNDGTHVTLKVLGADRSYGESNLTYTWIQTAGPSPAAIFSDGGTNTAKNAVALLSQAGTYTFQATITNAAGTTITSTASAVTVDAVATSVAITPASSVIAASGTAPVNGANSTEQLSASELDQFGNPMPDEDQPGFTWAPVSGGEGGSFTESNDTSTDSYTASTAAGADTIDVSSVNSDSDPTFTSQASIYDVTAAPATPTNLSVRAAERSIVLSWDPQQDAAAYNVYRGIHSGGESATPIATVSAPSTPSTSSGQAVPMTYTDTALNDSTTYYYTVKAVNPIGISSASAEAHATPAPFAPTGVTATPGNQAVGINWNAALGAVSYNLYESSSPGGEGTTPYQSGLTGTSFTDTQAASTAPNYYIVEAVYPSGLGDPSEEVSAQAESAVPTDPSSLVATAATYVDLSWTPSTGADRYIIERSTDGVTFKPLDQVDGSQASYQDTSIAPGVPYSYQVYATNAVGTSATISSSSATVVPVFTSISVTPNTAAINASQTEQFTAIALDQFGTPLITQPTSFAWSLTAGGGMIDASSGSYSAPSTLGSASVTATASSVSGTTDITIVNSGAPKQPVVTPTAVSPTEIDLSIPTPTDGSTLQVEEGPGNFATIYDPSGNPLSPQTSGGNQVFHITGLSPATSYSFRVRAILNGLENYSTSTAATTLALPGPDGVAPEAPVLQVSQYHTPPADYIQGSFTGPYDTGGTPDEWNPDYAAEIVVTGTDPYHLEGGADIDGANWLTAPEINGAWQMGVQQGDTPFTPYAYSVQMRVYDTTTQHSSSWSNAATTGLVDPDHPNFPAPPVLSATPLADNQVQLQYTVPDDGTGYVLSVFRLFNGVVTPLTIYGDGIVQGGPTGSQVFGFFTESIARGSNFWIEPYHSYYSKYSNLVSDVGIPVTPLHLSATPTSATGVGPVNLLWDNTPDNEDTFTVERATQVHTDGTLDRPFTLTPGGATTSTSATTSQGDVPAFVDQGAEQNSYFLEGQTYYYAALASNDNGKSDLSDVTAIAFPESCMTCSGGQLSATGDESNASGPTLTSQTGGWSAGSTISTTGSTTKPLFIAQLNGTDDEITVVYGPGQQTFFTLNPDGSYTEKFGGTDTLTHVSGQFILTDAGGNQSLFADGFTLEPAGMESPVISTNDAAGNSADVISSNSDGNPTEVRIKNAAGATTEDWLYSYIPDGDTNGGLLESVTQDIEGGSSLAATRILDYTYYDGTNSDGSAGDIRSATVTDGSGNVIDNEYYRYYVAGDSGGNVHQLKFQLGNDSIGRLETAYSSTALDSLTTDEIKPYADIYLAYNSADQVVTRTLQGEGCSACAGGQGTYTEQYFTSGNDPGVNSWQNETTETQPDGNQDITFYNSDGSTMLSIYKDTTTGQMWGTFTKYNANDQAILVAQPSAVNLPTGNSALATLEGNNDLLDYTSGNYTYLNPNSGLITLTDYPSSTTASTTAGNVTNYAMDTKIEQGQDGTPILQESMTYFAQSDLNGGTIYPQATDTTYANTDSTGCRTTSYSYTWQAGDRALQMASQTTTLPEISTADNGPNAPDSSTDVYNDLGQVVWSKDANGALTYNAYDTASGGLIKTIQDVNLSNPSDYDATYLPIGWTTPGNGGLNLVTTSAVDAQGRATETTSPDGNITYTVYNDGLNSSTGFENEVRTYPGWHQDATSGLWTTTGPVSVSRTNVPGSYSETLTYAYTPVSGVSTPIGNDTISSSNIQSLTRELTSAGGQMTESDVYVNLSGVTYTPATFHMGNATTLSTPGNYNATTYGYDTDGNPNKVTDPNGTITRTVNDGQGRPVSTWVGTSDTVSSGYWSPTNHGNMTEVSSNIYDGGGIGDGDLTETIQYPDGTTGERATLNYYDWQDREVAAKSGALVDSSGSPTPSSETDGVNRPISYSVYDNAGEVTTAETFDGDGVTISLSGGVPNAPSSSLLTGKTTTSYDKQGRAYETQTFSVTAGNGTVSSTALTSQIFYDLDGNVIAQAAPGGAWTKTKYDGADRPIETYITDGGAIAGVTGNWTNAHSVTHDVVLSQIDTTYDGDGNVILTADHERLPGDAQSGNSSIGALGNATGSGGPAANVYYVAGYFDDADRETASVNVGTNGGAAYTRPSTIPTGNDTTLVTTTAYGDDGMPSVVTDPRGIQSLTEYDLLGETTETVAAWDGTSTPTAGNSTNQITLYKYDGDGNEISMIAVLPTGNQTTGYIYDVSPSTGSGIFSNDLLAKVEYPDATTGNASTSASDDVSYSYDALGETTAMTDQNGTTHAYIRDALGRPALDSVTLPSGSAVDNSVLAIGLSYNSQGLPDMETSYSNAAGTTIANQDQEVYNGLGQLTGEFQSVSGAVNSSTPEVQYSFSDPSLGSRPTGMEYPNGRELDYVYNSGIDTTIGRVSSIADAAGSAAGDLQTYSYQGVGTIIGFADGNGVTENTTLDNFGRDAEIKYVNSSSVTTDDFAYGYDRDSNVLYKDNLLNSAESELYHANGVASNDAYDPLNRLTDFERGTLTASGSTLDTVTSPSASQSFNLNAVGDQSSVTTNGTTTTNSTNAKNELTTNGANSLTFDNNGNTLTDENGQTSTYDAWNHQVTVKNSGGTVIADYGYDAQGRRITEANATVTTDVYFSNQWQAIEERVGGTVTRQNVWGAAYVNQLIERDDNSVSGTLGISGSGLGERLYAQQDANWNVTSLVDSSGAVVQRMVYSPYGAVTFLTASWAPSSDAYAQNVLFQGGRLETGTGDYIFERRDYNPTLGLWMQQDRLGYVDGAALNQAYEDNPATLTDYMGLCVAGKKYSPTVEVHVSVELSTPDNDAGQADLVDAAGGLEKLDTVLSILDYGNIAAASDIPEALSEAVKIAAEQKLDWPEPDAEKLANALLKWSNKKKGEFEGWTLYTRINYKDCICVHHWYHAFIGTNELQDEHTPWVQVTSGGETGTGDYIKFTSAWSDGKQAGEDALAKWKADNQNDLGD